ncbi:hypothetical protein PVAP13_2NG524184 [Panicum virgatum]|uniref:Uncharacterized protein n=1 Tax=Panicum virgatum TaxID=38727 RepID=A0A8T0VGL5_PANVG|nr:hypothetical protein PVAP13_2NG524184 [Panicum virgatum]
MYHLVENFKKRSAGTGSNDPRHLQGVHPAPLLEDTGCPEAMEHTVQTPRKKCGVKKKTYTKKGSS